MILKREKREIQPGSYINFDDYLKYDLNLPCEPDDDKIIISTDDGIMQQEIKMKYKKPPNYVSKKLNLQKGRKNIFEDNPLNTDIKTVKFKKSNIENIKISFDENFFEKVVPEKEYDAKFKFFFDANYSGDNDRLVVIKFVLKDIYDISSDTLEIEVTINPSIKWFKEWYSILVIILGILGALYGLFKWMKENKHVELWESFKKCTRSCCGCIKGKLCCCFCRKKPRPIPEEMLINDSR